MDEALNSPHTAYDRQLRRRMRVYLQNGIVTDLPNRWQVLQGEWEMAPYVVVPDDDDAVRYAGAPMGNPLLRTPIVLFYIGLDHFRIGTGLGASKSSIIKHLNIVHHQVMPDWDLQLLQLKDGGLEELRWYINQLDSHRPSLKHRMHKKLIDAVMPDAKLYRQSFIEPGGWIDRASNFDYTPDQDIPDDLRAEFFSLTRFLEWCNTLPKDCGRFAAPKILLHRMLTLTREKKQSRSENSVEIGGEATACVSCRHCMMALHEASHDDPSTTELFVSSIDKIPYLGGRKTNSFSCIHCNTLACFLVKGPRRRIVQPIR